MSYAQMIEEMEFTHTSEAEWDRAEAWELGQQNPDCQWICTDRDAWHKNPFYKGPPQPHPEYGEIIPEPNPSTEIDLDDIPF